MRRLARPYVECARAVLVAIGAERHWAGVVGGRQDRERLGTRVDDILQRSAFSDSGSNGYSAAASQC